MNCQTFCFQQGTRDTTISYRPHLRISHSQINQEPTKIQGFATLIRPIISQFPTSLITRTSGSSQHPTSISASSPLPPPPPPQPSILERPETRQLPLILYETMSLASPLARSLVRSHVPLQPPVTLVAIACLTRPPSSTLSTSVVVYMPWISLYELENQPTGSGLFLRSSSWIFSPAGYIRASWVPSPCYKPRRVSRLRK